MRFAEIIGHQSLKQRLVESIDKGRVSHAQLFSGEAGSGTLPLAIAYAQYLNCPDNLSFIYKTLCNCAHRLLSFRVTLQKMHTKEITG